MKFFIILTRVLGITTLVVLSVLVALAYLAGTASGAWPFDATCDVTNHMGRESPSGSGTYLGSAGDKGFVVSCAHLFEGGKGQVTCAFPATGRWYKGEVVGIGPGDLAGIVINKPEGIKPVKVARCDPKFAPFTAVGFPYYGPKDKPCFTTGKLVGMTDGEIYTDSEFHSGYSGGTLFDRRGRQVGVTVGNNGKPNIPYMVFDKSRSVGNDTFLNFVSRWVKVYE